MDFFGPDKTLKVEGIFGDDYKFPSDASLQHSVVGSAATPEFKWMLGHVLARFIQSTG